MLFVIQLTLAKKDTFGTIIKCISKSRYVRIIESQIMGVRTNAGTNSRCPSYRAVFEERVDCL